MSRKMLYKHSDSKINQHSPHIMTPIDKCKYFPKPLASNNQNILLHNNSKSAEILGQKQGRKTYQNQINQLPIDKIALNGRKFIPLMPKNKGQNVVSCKMRGKDRPVSLCHSERSLKSQRNSLNIPKNSGFPKNLETDRIKSKRQNVNQIPKSDFQESWKLTLLQWVILIHKIFREQFTKHKAECLKISTLTFYLNSSSFKENTAKTLRSIGRLHRERQIQKKDLIKKLENYLLKKKIEQSKKEQRSLHFIDLFHVFLENSPEEDPIDCLPRKTSKNQKPEKIEENEEIVQTARFQQQDNKVKEVLKEKGSKQLTQQKVHPRQESISSRHSDAPKENFNRESLNRQSPLGKSLMATEDKSRLQKGSIIVPNFQIESPKAMMMSEIIKSTLSNLSFSQHNHNVSFSIDNEPIDQELSLERSVESLSEVLQNLKKQYQEDKQMLEISRLLQQLIDYSLYKNKNKNRQNSAIQKHKKGDNEYFQGVKLVGLQSNNTQSMALMIKILKSPIVQEYIHSMEGIKISECDNLIPTFLGMLHNRMHIINLSSNGLTHLNPLLEKLKKYPNISLRFLNLNQNKIQNVSAILSCFRGASEIHLKHNLIDHISGEYPQNALEILDLGYNLIRKQEDLSAIKCFNKLRILNLAHNEIIKQHLVGLIPGDIIYQYEDLEMMSEYVQYKDMTFGEVCSLLKDKNIVQQCSLNPIKHSASKSQLTPKHALTPEKALNNIFQPSRKNSQQKQVATKAAPKKEKQNNIAQMKQKIKNIKAIIGNID